LTRDGVTLHAKHALMPNNLGYCGPDENGKILEHLHGASPSESLLTTLKEFEAAYPFIRMIAKSTGKDPFDYEVTEAYWIGNRLLERVEPTQFYEFAHRGPASHLSKEAAKTIFREVGPSAKPHHTFYVLGMYGRSNGSPESEKKLLELIDSCRISWGRVVGVKEKTLTVERSPLVIRDDQLSLAKPVRKEVTYDRGISPFETIRAGDWVSLHWNFASEKLKRYQLKNLSAYTALDIEATNRFVRSREWKKRS
jgi:uncharacterized protein DUF6390